jgi:ABC-2 type transport system ATP-binding protein
MIVLEEVHKWFGAVHAVRGVSLELPASRIIGLLGPNGAGKTTTIRMIVGFLMPDRGRIMVGGQDTADSVAGARAKIGYMPESSPIYPEMRVHEYLHYRASIFGLNRPTRLRNINKVISWCGLVGMERRRVGALSKGFKQRLALAAALLHDPPVLILDEPTNGLDPGQIGEVRALVKQLGQERTMLVSSHILPEIERLCDSAVVIAGGEVRAYGTLEQVAISGSGPRGGCVAKYYVSEQPEENEVADTPFIRELRSAPEIAAVFINTVRTVAGCAVELNISTKPAIAGNFLGGSHDHTAERACLVVARLAYKHTIILHSLSPILPSLERAFANLVTQDAQGAKL